MSPCSTSYVEKQNHTVRMRCRRLSRLTNAFSKKRENFGAAVALHYAYSNFCKRHTTIRCTPAMEAGIVNPQWTTASVKKDFFVRNPRKPNGNHGSGWRGPARSRTAARRG